jgi:hypothetical protein
VSFKKKLKMLFFGIDKQLFAPLEPSSLLEWVNLPHCIIHLSQNNDYKKNTMKGFEQRRVCMKA